MNSSWEAVKVSIHQAQTEEVRAQGIASVALSNPVHRPLGGQIHMARTLEKGYPLVLGWGLVCPPGGPSGCVVMKRGQEDTPGNVGVP